MIMKVFVLMTIASLSFSSMLVNNRHKSTSFLQDDSELTPYEDIESYIQEFANGFWPYNLVKTVIWDYCNDGKISKEERDTYFDKLDVEYDILFPESED